MMFESFDGTRLNVVEMGAGPPVVLVHGLFSNAHINWIKYGTAQKLVDAGYRLILPDLRGHGESEAPENWPENALVRDLQALIAHYGLTDYVLGGFSMGGRTTMRALAAGETPRAAILAGMGLRGTVEATDRVGWFINLIEKRDTWKRGDPEFLASAFMKANVRHPERLLPMLRQQQATPPAVLATFRLPILVVCGADDHDNGSAEELVAALPDAIYREVPGNHMTSVTHREFGDAILAFLQKVFP